MRGDQKCALFWPCLWRFPGFIYCMRYSLNFGAEWPLKAPYMGAFLFCRAPFLVATWDARILLYDHKYILASRLVHGFQQTSALVQVSRNSTHFSCLYFYTDNLCVSPENGSLAIIYSSILYMIASLVEEPLPLHI